MDREPLAPTLKGGLTDDPESTLSGCIRFMPDSMYYLANFISLDEEASILSEVGVPL